MKKLRRHPQYVLMLDLLILMLFSVLSAPPVKQAICYTFSGNTLPPDCMVLWTNPPQPTCYWNRETRQWLNAVGKIDPGTSIFVKMDVKPFFPISKIPSDNLMLAIRNPMAERIRNLIFETCSMGPCSQLTIHVLSDGRISIMTR